MTKRDREHTDGRIDAMPRQKFTAIEQAAKALAQLSDAEWLQVTCNEERRRRAMWPPNKGSFAILSTRRRELRDRKPEPSHADTTAERPTRGG
jgi:hypothetical protein